MKSSRRNLLTGAASLMAGGGLALCLQRQSFGQDQPKGVPWPYKKLDPEAVAEIAYQEYYKGACCYGVFESIIGQLRKEVGAPYTYIPTQMMVYGEGGVAGIGTLCGALNGAAAAIFLFTAGFDKPAREPAFNLMKDLYTWYEQTALPVFRPAKPKFEIAAKSVARSTLCHASVSNWCKASKFKSFSNERSERCGWVTGSVAKFTVELLNAHADKSFKRTHNVAPAVQACIGCHEKGGAVENTRAMMDCGGCHFTGKMAHPGKS